jgi:hypothetical protein
MTIHNDGRFGGVCNPILTNVTFSGNAAIEEGGAMYNNGSGDGFTNPQVLNSILWNNQSGGVTGTITIYNMTSTVVLSHSLVEASGGSTGWVLDASYVDGGNIDTDPMFVIPVNPSSAPTSDGALHLKSGSPAIDKAENLYFTGVPVDLDGFPRFVDGDLNGTLIIDMGAYEYQIDYPFEHYTPVIFQ